jgi:predicted DNA-binding protein|tara:strand:- start:817 stop:1017 length:201 start_codon:yes stop_codon:yes gene_type:complete
MSLNINQIEKTILSTKKFKNKCTMFGINLGLELNQRLTNYAKINKVSKASVVKSLLVAYLNEKESK